MAKDTILSSIFSDKQPADSISSPEQIEKSSAVITAAIKELNVPGTNKRQRAAIANHGSPDLRERSQACCDLLARRPGLGQKRGLTAERYQVVISKHRRYDAMTTNIGVARSAVQIGLATVEARLTTNAGTVLTYANDLIVSNDNARVREYFLPIGNTLDELARREAEKLSRLDNNQKPAEKAVADAKHNKQVVPGINRMQQAARQGVDLHAELPAAPKKKTKKTKTKQ